MGWQNCCCSGCTPEPIADGADLTDPADWNIYGAAFNRNGGVGDSFDTTSPRLEIWSSIKVPLVAEDIADVLTELGSDKGSGAYSGWGGLLTGNTDPLPTFFNDGLGYDVPSGTSVNGSVIFRDFTGTGGDTIFYQWAWSTTERVEPLSTPPTDNVVDFAFVSIQRQGSAGPTVERLADTCSPLLTYLGLAWGSGTPGVAYQGLCTGPQPGSIVLPGSGSGTYRLAFGSINVQDTLINSILEISDTCATPRSDLTAAT